VRGYSARQDWRRRVMAVVAAYVIALTSLVSNLAAARAAAEMVAHPLGVLCHGQAVEGADFPADQHNNGLLCVDCCAGCLMPLAALPPPSAVEVPSPAALSQRVPLIAPIVLSPASKTKSHRSRAPPLSA
jgi:hypothetical protein